MTDDPLSGAIRWIASLLTGTIATSTCIVAIAALGFLLLSGSLPVARGIRVVIGCFILFGAPLFASAMTSAAPTSVTNEIVAPLPPTPVQGTASAPAWDPYAGASIQP